MATDTATTNGVHDDVWGMEVKPAGTGGAYTPLTAGNYPAQIVGLFDIGHHETTSDDGRGYWARKLVLVVEVDEQQPSGKPYVYCKEYTWSLGTTSNFRKMVQAVTGQTFKDGDRFDPRSLVGLACMATISNKPGRSKSGDERTYDGLDSLSGYPKKMPLPGDPTYGTHVWSVLTDTPFPDGLDWLPRLYGETVADKARLSREGLGLPATAKAADDPSKTSKATKATRPATDPNLPPVPGPATVADDDSDIPF